MNLHQQQVHQRQHCTISHGDLEMKPEEDVLARQVILLKGALQAQTSCLLTRCQIAEEDCDRVTKALAVKGSGQ